MPGVQPGDRDGDPLARGEPGVADRDTGPVGAGQHGAAKRCRVDERVLLEVRDSGGEVGLASIRSVDSGGEGREFITARGQERVRRDAKDCGQGDRHTVQGQADDVLALCGVGLVVSHNGCVQPGREEGVDGRFVLLRERREGGGADVVSRGDEQGVRVFGLRLRDGSSEHGSAGLLVLALTSRRP